MKTLSILLALINSLVAGLLIIFNVSTSIYYYNGVWDLILRNASALMVVFFGLVTWLASMTDSNSGAVLLGGVALVIIGTAFIVWAYHLTVVKGQMEFFMAGYGASLTIQGLSSLLGFSMETRNAAV